MQIPKFGSSGTASGSHSAPKSALRLAFARGVGRNHPRPGAPCATVARPSATRHPGPATPGCAKPACPGGIPAKAKACERERAGRQAAERRAADICIRCGKAPAGPERTACEDCLEKRRAADRTRYAAGKAAGKLYGGADPAVKRRSGRAKSRRRQKARKEAGLCIRCGKRRPVDGGTTCAPCRDRRQAAERQQYAERRAARLCSRCGGPVHDGLSRCAPCAVIDEAGRCPERKNARSRRLYWKRRSAGLCTACGAPSLGACRCPECAKRSYEGSAHFRGMPLYPPSYAVFLRATEECLATFDDEMEVAAWLAFEKLTRDQVEVVADRPWLAALTAWE